MSTAVFYPARPCLLRVAALVVLSLLLAPADLRAQETPYEVTLEGVEDGDLRDLLTQVSALFRLQQEPPPSPVSLRRRAERDRDRLFEALRAEGYYDAAVEIDVATDAAPAEVVIEVFPGPRYTFDDTIIESVDETDLPVPAPDREALGLPRGAPARGAAVVGAEGRIRAAFRAEGHAFAEVPQRQAIIDTRAKTMDVTYLVEPGPLVRLGEVTIEGLERVDEDLVLNRVPWEPGAVYDPELLDEYRVGLLDLGVFASVRLDVGEDIAPDGTVPVTVVVDERLRRFIGAGLTLSTDVGLGARLYWGHRNLFAGAERFRIEGAVGRVGTDDPTDPDLALSATLTKPDFLAVDQTLTLDAALVRETPDAFERNALTLSAGLTRPIFEDIIVGAGVTFEQAAIDDGTSEGDFTLLGLPLTLDYDTTDNLLNQTRGYRLGLRLTPYFDFGETSNGFVVSRASGTTYFDLTGNGRIVAAGRLVLGSISGAETDAIPADKRFYAGGGGSVRGYGFQEIGPRDEDGDPFGGRSLIETSAELRIMVTETIGIVPFVDAGQVFDTTLPNLDDELEVGAGLGVRYLTPIGPLRLDVAVPINPQDEDDPFQLYMSIGQAF